MTLSLGLVAATWSFLLWSPVKCAAPSLNVPLCSSIINSQWSVNSENQSPCQVAGYLGSVCNPDGSFEIGSLGGTTEEKEYTLPSQAQTNCTCSTAFYTTLSACASCQGAGFIPWKVWSTNCSTVYIGYPNPIPSGTAVPQWAYQNVTTNPSFNVTLAESIGDSPESTALPSSTSTSSISAPSTATSTASSSSGSNSSKGKTNAGAIAGGVVGALVFITAVVLIALVLLRRSRRRKPQNRPSSPVLLDDTHIPRPFPIHGPTPRFYNPSDPSTFPSSQNTIPTQSTGSQPARISHYHSTSDDTSRYQGMAEI